MVMVMVMVKDVVMVTVYLDIVVLSIIVLDPVIVLSLRAGRQLHGAAQPRLVSGGGRVGVEVVGEGRTGNMVIITLLSIFKNVKYRQIKLWFWTRSVPYLVTYLRT